MRLVMVHGRAQEGKDQVLLRKEWLDALTYGLARADRTLPAQTVVDFPYYGDQLAKLVTETSTPLGATINAKGPNPDAAADAEFRGKVIADIAAAMGLTDADIRRELAGPVAKGPGNWEWVQAILRALDRVPGINSAAIDAFTRDVYVYLTYPGVRRKIDRVVDDAIGDGNCVVLAHSLGTVVAYNVLRQRQGALHCPRLVTVGSPLGIEAIKQDLETPLTFPVGVGNWFNAYDERDFVALVPLDARHFDVSPAIDNYDGVRNFTDNRHGIAGYLSDATVATKLAEFL